MDEWWRWWWRWCGRIWDQILRWTTSTWIKKKRENYTESHSPLLPYGKSILPFNWTISLSEVDCLQPFIKAVVHQPFFSDQQTGLTLHRRGFPLLQHELAVVLFEKIWSLRLSNSIVTSFSLGTMYAPPFVSTPESHINAVVQRLKSIVADGR